MWLERGAPGCARAPLCGQLDASPRPVRDVSGTQGAVLVERGRDFAPAAPFRGIQNPLKKASKTPVFAPFSLLRFLIHLRCPPACARVGGPSRVYPRGG